MLTKLAFKNAGKSIRDYAIYFFTLVFGVCIFYMFNSIYAQQEVMVVTETMNKSMILLRQVLSYISVFVAIVLGFLIIYANNFFIKRRKKELGIYMVLGMKKRSISIILILETFVMAIAALCVGLLLGVFGSQFMSIFTAKLFEADMTGFAFVFSLDATLKSILYFSLIFAIVMIFNTCSIGKFKLIDLLYGANRNERYKGKTKRHSIFLFIVSIICLAIAYFLILWNGMIELNMYFTVCIILGIIGTFLFFYSIAGIIRIYIVKKERIYFKDLNMFIARQIFSKINSNFVSISIICLCLLLVIGIFSTGYSLQEIFSSDIAKTAKYDFSFYNYDYEYDDVDDDLSQSIYENLQADFNINSYVSTYQEYSTYIERGNTFSNYYEVPQEYNLYAYKNLMFIRLSDYNDLMTMISGNKLDLSEDECALIYNNNSYLTFIDSLISNINEIEVGKHKVKLKESVQESLSNSTDICYFVVNDQVLQDMEIYNTVLNINTKSSNDEYKLYNLLEKYREADEENSSFKYYRSKIEIYYSSISTKVIVSFLAIYLGIVFMVASAAILAIQQLSDAADNRNRYRLLSKLGADKNMMNKALFKQIMIYFLSPLLLAIIHSIVGLTAANAVIYEFGKVNVWSGIIVTAIFVIFIYLFYFILTYIGSKNIIKN